MGKLTLFLLTILAFWSIFSLTSIQDGASESENRFNEHGAKILAREVALTGLNEGTQTAFDDFETSGTYTGVSPLTGNYEGGAYSVTISASGNGIDIKSVGTFREARHTISRSYYYNTGGGSVPEFMSRPITCDGNFVTKDDFNLSNASDNTDVHTNGNLRFESGNAYIGGFGSYNGNLELLNGQSESDIFNPVSNPGGAPLTEHVAEIDVPVFTAGDHLSSATATYFSDLELSGNVNLGTQENPAIWYVDGNVKIVGAVTFSGYGVILAKGNFEIEYNVSTTGGVGESSVAFYTEGNITIKNGGLNMAGQWLLNGNVEVEDNTTFSGSITATGNCYFDKSFNMSYVEASSVLTEPLWSSSGSTGGTLELVSASEW